MKLSDINETVFQALTPEIQQKLIEVSQTAESNEPMVIGIVAVTITALFIGILLID